MLRVRVVLSTIPDASHDGHVVCLQLVVCPERSVPPELELHLPPSERHALAVLHAALLSSLSRPATLSACAKLLQLLCAQLRLPAESSSHLLGLLVSDVPIVPSLARACDAARAMLPEVDARWAVVWATLCALMRAGLHDATSARFVDDLARALCVPLQRVRCAEDCLAAELGIIPAAARSGRTVTLSDAPVGGGSLNRRWALALSALGGGAALAVGTPVAGIALAGVAGGKAVFLLGAAASSATAHCALQPDALLLPAELHGGCRYGAAEGRAGLRLHVYCGLDELACSETRVIGAPSAGATASAAPTPSAPGVGADSARRVWLTLIRRVRFGEHRVLHWQHAPGLARLAELLSALAREREPGWTHGAAAAPSATRGGSQATGGAAAGGSSLLVAAWERLGTARALGASANGSGSLGGAALVWHEGGARAEWCGATLASKLLARRAAGQRPVALVGASLGAALVFSCLAELAVCGAHGVVSSVCLLGAPIAVADPRWDAAVSVVADRFVNVYCRTDDLLAQLGAIGPHQSKAPRVASAARHPGVAADAALAGVVGARRVRLAGAAGDADAHSTLRARASERIEDVEIDLGLQGHATYARAAELAQFVLATDGHGAHFFCGKDDSDGRCHSNGSRVAAHQPAAGQ